jgi:hypothetical protein
VKSSHTKPNDSVTIVALYEKIEPAADALKILKDDMNITSDDLMVMTSVPLPEGVLTTDSSRSNLPIITVISAFIGIGLGILLAGGTAVLYVLRTGGKPILSGPPIGIIAYEMMMLVALTTAFIVALYEMRLPSWRVRAYDPRISEGMIGVAIHCAKDQVDSIKAALDKTNVQDYKVDSRNFN